MDKYPHILAAITALAPTHAERQRALGMSPSRYWQTIAGDVPEGVLRRWLTHMSVVHAVRRDLGLDTTPADAPCAANHIASIHEEEPHV